MLPITVLGSGGWIGSALVADLRRQSIPVQPVDRACLPEWPAGEDRLGPVIYGIGLTGDFRQQPHATVQAHGSFESGDATAWCGSAVVSLVHSGVSKESDTHETAPLPCLSVDASDLYNLSKLLGESLVLQDPRPGFGVVRLSNVVGPGQPANTLWELSGRSPKSGDGHDSAVR